MAKKATKSVEDQLIDAKAELATVHRFLEKVQSFSGVISKAKRDLVDLKAEEEELASKLKVVREEIREAKGQIESASDGILAILEPGPVVFMPLFDRMEKAVPQKHGPNSSKWREQPISVLKLSPLSTSMLYEAEILFIGQLQDKVMEAPNEWWEYIPGLTQPIAAAISDKLADFVAKGGAL